MTKRCNMQTSLGGTKIQKNGESQHYSSLYVVNTQGMMSAVQHVQKAPVCRLLQGSYLIDDSRYKTYFHIRNTVHELLMLNI